MSLSRGRTTLVAVVVGVLAATAGCGSETAGGPGAAPPEDAFDCPTGLEPWGADDAPAIDDLAEQQQAADGLVARTATRSTFTVAHAEPSALGVVALVRGNVTLARRVLPMLVDTEVLVGRWSEPQPESGFGLRAQARQVVESRLLPVVDEIDREVRRSGEDGEGDTGRVVWAEAGTVVVQWKDPVPEAVAGLAGVRDDGVEVVVQPTRYSQADIARASDTVGEWLAEEGAPAVNGSTGCADGSGLVVGMVEPVEDPAALAAELTEVAGMPVLVEEEPPVTLEEAPADEG